MANMTKVYLLNVPLENDYKNTLYFASKTAQQDYFLSRVVHSYADFSYQRKDNIIRVPEHFDNLLNCNYVMYQNPAYSNKWFYAFITDLKYIDDNRTDLSIETDCLQTWLFDYTVKSSFVEREHVNDDTIGIHTVPEQLETGDYISGTKYKYAPLTNNIRYIIGSTVDLRKDTFPNYGGVVMNGIISGVAYFYYTSQASVENVLSSLANAGKIDAITSVFMVPSDFITLDTEGTSGNLVLPSFAPIIKKWSASQNISKPTNINGYKPKNNKLFTYPYCYMLMSNNSGAGAVYKYELFNSSLCDFNINFALTPGCSIRLIPLNYNGVTENNEEGLTGGKFPVGGWASDIYTNWLTQNALNISVQLAQGAFSAVTGGISGGVSGGISGAGAGAVGGVPGAIAGGVAGAVGGAVGGASSGFFSIASTMAEKYAHSLQPAQASGNLNSGDVTCSNSDLTFTAYQMSVKAEYAKIIDGYLTMFGYRVNEIKVPNKNHRSRFWYTKTIDVNIDGPIPNRDMQIIKDCYNKGLTFWRSASDINNYTDANNIL